MIKSDNEIGKHFCSSIKLEMSSSWNFPVRAEPSYEGSKPSRAELGHFNFRAETELTILTICMSFFFENVYNFAPVSWFQ